MGSCEVHKAAYKSLFFCVAFVVGRRLGGGGVQRSLIIIVRMRWLAFDFRLK